MNNNKIIDEYIKFNKLLLSTIKTKTKTIEVIDGDGIKEYSYRDFFLYMSEHFDLNPSFINKAIVIIESLDTKNQQFEFSTEYKKNNGEPADFVYNILRETNDEFLLFIRENKTNYLEHLDQMTKANPKSYIDNRAKNNILTKTPFVLMYIDIDNFKQINDEYGQVIGDMILIEMVSVSKNILGDRGAISRVGGDRFLLIYEIDDDYDKVHNFLFDLKQQMQRLSSTMSRGISITLTIGSAQYPSDGEYELLLRKCKKALIRGKNKGRDCFVMYIESKCGKVTLDDEIQDKIVKINNVSAKNDVYSLITSVNQLLANEKNFDQSIDEAISLIGSYFYVDRISIARLNIKNFKIKQHHAWYNPKISIKYPAYCIDEIIPIWGEALGAKKYINVEDIDSTEDSFPLKKLFAVDHTTASIAFELIVNQTSFGLIRFDMTTGIRHWQTEDFQIFMLLSQLFASYIQKNYLINTNYDVLYKDNKYGCNNFSRMFTDAGDMIISGKINEYAIIETEVRNIIRYREIIGKKRMKELIYIFVNSFEENNALYGKINDGPFVVFVGSHDKSVIEKIINKIKNDLNKFFKKYSLHLLNVRTGVYFADAKVDTLINSIDAASLTRNINETEEILYYSDKIKNKSLFNTKMVLRFDEALEKKEFLLYLQPKISTKTGRLIGAEALTRWNYNFEKLLFPNDFIPIFEEQGLIEKLDFCVFENVCRYQKYLLDNNLEVVPISVNVSRYILNFDSYVKNLELIRKKYNIDPKYIEVEITEGMYYENIDSISIFINNLHKLGYSVSMDDFGAGYSNLVSMAKLNFDVIKFDRSFCLGLENEKVKIMLNELIKLIKTMNMKTICEGVETKENVEYLTAIGCDSIQGYYYSKPIEWNDFIKKYYNK